MISVFYAFNDNIKTLHHTLSHYNNRTIILYDNGFLPEEITTPYQYFSNRSKKQRKPLFFNEVPVPELWEIEGTHKGATILDDLKVRGRIVYTDFSNSRLVQRVEWFNSAEKVVSVDYYDQYGMKFAEEIYDEGNKVLVRHFNEQGHEVIYQNFITNDVILTWNNKVYHFDTYSKFIIFFLLEINKANETILTSNFNFVYSIMNQLPKSIRKIIVLQDKVDEKIQNEVTRVITQLNHNFVILTPYKDDYEKLVLNFSDHSNKIYQFGYYYSFAPYHKKNKEAFILTATDQINNIEHIVTSCKDITFNIAAISEMSDKLLDLNRFNNVVLHPVIKEREINRLLQQCRIYLDINSGAEVNNIIKKAFLHNMLILASKTTVHNSELVAEEFIFTDEALNQLINCLVYYASNEEQYFKGVQIQKSFALSIEKEDIVRVLRDAEK